ncbi:MAG: radical SAM protein [Phycisphaera sp.]|nr:radical SAM protein [Phycisphaera sp.]
MLPRLTYRMLTTVSPRCMAKFAWNFGVKGTRSVMKFKSRLKRGVVFPPFLYISIINSCNLRCQGCWVDVAHERSQIDLPRMNRLINDAKSHGNAFFGILGGEPFMHDELFDVLEAHPDCYFQIFTNGQFITEEKAARLRKLGNATPLISIEGTEIISDERRGRSGVLSKTMKGLDNCIAAGVITGVATSLCQTNIDDLLREEWVDALIARGAHYMWYHVYRPVGPDPNPAMSLNPDQARRVRQFVVDMRCKKPIGIVDAYYDGKGQALCPAATGISHHISPWGDIEPCPIVQFARENIDDERGIYETMTQSTYLKDFRDLARKTTRGCIVLERPDLLKDFVTEQDAADSTARKTGLSELAAMDNRGSQYQRGDEIPEKHWLYRIAKKFFFNDFGVYAELEKAVNEAHHEGAKDTKSGEGDVVQVTTSAAADSKSRDAETVESST